MLAVPRKSLLPCLALSVCLICFTPTCCVAWGSTAHRVIARIAIWRLNQLSPKALARAQAILGKEDFVAVSTYADEIRLLRRDTSAWHFVDIPVSASTYVAKRDCVDDNCIVAVVERFERVLESKAKGSDQEALKFLIHLVGDLSQPFHCYDDNDRGGNLIAVKFGGRLTNLHAVWDTYMLERMMADATAGAKTEMNSAPSSEDAYAARLIDMFKHPERLIARQPGLTRQDIDGWDKGTPEDWAVDSHRIALKALNLKVGAQPLMLSPQPQNQPTSPKPSKPPVGIKKTSNRAAAEWAGEMDFSFAQSPGQKSGKGEKSPAPKGWDVPAPELSRDYYAVNSAIVEQQLLKAGLRLARLLNDILNRSATP